MGGEAKNRAFRYPAPKQAGFSLVERDRHVRSLHVSPVNSKTVRPIIDANVNKASAFMTDESTAYRSIGATFCLHGAVNHSPNEYARAYFRRSNTVERYFSLLKHAVFETFHDMSEAHLHRYTAELDFKWNARKAKPATTCPV